MNGGADGTAGQSARDAEHMGEALRLAAHGLYNTAPNPTVGCVLVKDERVVGSGWTAPAGGPHAERVALENAGAEARGATAYVTLEPCCHVGRTGPCTQALIEAGVARVVFAGHDPNPRVDGGGARELRAAGVEVEGGLLEQAAEPLNRGFFTRMRRGTPWVRSKLAASLDGRTALANGASRWITGAAARADVHVWRSRSSAILTGSGTVRADDPALTARPEDAGLDPAIVKQPLRAIVDARLTTPPTAKTLHLPGDVRIFTTTPDGPAAAALRAAGAHLEAVPGREHCDLTAVLARLGALEINDVWVEAGAGLNGALLAAGLIDELIVYTAPIVLGAAATGMFAVPEPASLEHAWRFTFEECCRVGDDLRIIARPSRVAGALGP
jgi:diaminohydroxyphosphoribosylaminopyrimidine deaminase / 5-amino-6-(5-phosphoribosylamino)uracil reductase